MEMISGLWKLCASIVNHLPGGEGISIETSIRRVLVRPGGDIGDLEALYWLVVD